MNSIVTALLATAVLGAPVLNHDSPRTTGAHHAEAATTSVGASQTPQAAQPRPPAPAPQAELQPAQERERTPAPAPAAPAALAVPPPERRPVPTRNVKVDVTITEQAGTAAPVKKVVSLVVADGRSSGVRSMANVPLATGPYRELPLHVDASVNVTPEQRVLLELRFNYTSVSVMTPIAGEGMPTPTTPAQQEMRAPKPGFSSINDSLTLLLTPGSPVVAARSADAASDRTVTVEVKAEILK